MKKIFLKREFLKKKKLPGEECQDEESRSITPLQKFKINSFNILDTIINSIGTRFVNNENILKDCNWLDPKLFLKIKSMEIFPNDALKTISELAEVDRQTTCMELKQFASQYRNFQPHLPIGESEIYQNDDINNQQELFEDSECESEDEIPKTPNCNKCRNCIYCAYITIRELSFQSNLFSNLLVVYKYILLLPSTQVTCERIFSKLKIVKTKLRSTLNQEHLGPLMMMAVEKDLPINKEKLIDDVANSSNLLKSLLI